MSQRELRKKASGLPSFCLNPRGQGRYKDPALFTGYVPPACRAVQSQVNLGSFLW